MAESAGVARTLAGREEPRAAKTDSSCATRARSAWSSSKSKDWVVFELSIACPGELYNRPGETERGLETWAGEPDGIRLRLIGDEII